MGVMKKIVFIGLMLLSSLAVSEVSKEGTSDHVKTIAKNVSVGLLQAKLEAACQKKVDLHNRYLITNPEQCGAEVDLQITELGGSPEFSEYIADVKDFKSRYQL